MSFKDTFKTFAKELRRDKVLYRVYQANIAMAYYDCANWEGSRDSSAKAATQYGQRLEQRRTALLQVSTRKDLSMFDIPPDNYVESYPCLCGGDITMDDDGIYRCSKCEFKKSPQDKGIENLHPLTAVKTSDTPEGKIKPCTFYGNCGQMRVTGECLGASCAIYSPA